MRKKWNPIYTIVFNVLISFLMISCGSNNQDKKMEKGSSNVALKTENNLDILWNNTKSYTFNQKEQFKNSVENARDKLNNKIFELEDKAENASGTAKDEYNKTVEKLKEEREVLNKKMSNFNDVRRTIGRILKPV